MQTFLPIKHFDLSAKILDNKRLGKQRVETKQIYLALQPDSESSWRNHPAVLMWKGCEKVLLHYGIAMCVEWKNRGYNDSLLEFFVEEDKKFTKSLVPVWLGNEDFHASHRSNLLRKDPVYYGQFGWTEPDNLPYFWPTKEGLM